METTNLFTDKDLELMKEHYIYASNASYLFRKFGEIENVRLLTQKHKVSDLVIAISNLDRRKSFNEFLICYGILISFYYLDREEAIRICNLINVSKLDYGEDIRKFILTQRWD